MVRLVALLSRPLWQHGIAALALLALAGVAYGPIAMPGRAPASIYSDVIAVHLGLKQTAFESWQREGRLPFWQDHQFAGGPALTNPQALYLHPLHAAFLFLPPAAALGLTLLLQLWAAGLGCYALARALGLSWLSSFFAGSVGVLAFKGTLGVEAGWLVPLATMALVPYWIVGLMRLSEEPGLARALQLAAFAAVGLDGGNPQPLYYACLLFVPYAIYLEVSSPPRDLGRVARRAGFIVLGLGLGLACNAYLWWPVFAERALMARSGAGADYTFFLSGHGLGIAQLSSLISPDGLGTIEQEPWEETAYFGWLPFGLALIGAVSSRARSAQRYLAYAFAATLVLSVDSPILRAVHAFVPGYAAFRLPARILFLTVYLGAALSGAGLARVALVLRARPRLTNGVLSAVFAIVIAEGVYLARTHITVAPLEQLLPDANHPLRSMHDDGMRTAVGGRGTFNYGWAQALHLHLVNGYDPYNYVHYRRFFSLICDGTTATASPGNWVDLPRLARPDLLDQLAVRTLLMPAIISAPGFELRAEYPAVRNFVMYRGMQSAPLYVYENRNAQPLARFARQVVALPSLAAVESALASTRVVDTAYVVADSASTGAAAASGGPAPEVRVERQSPGAMTLRVSTGTRRLLVVAAPYHPGWQIEIDGRSTAPVQADLALLGVWTPAGARRVHLHFEPPGFQPGVLVSIAALALLLGAGAFCFGRARLRVRVHA